MARPVKRTRAQAANDLRNLKRRVERARNFPHNTCPASRHLHTIADQLAGKRRDACVNIEDRQHLASSIYAVLEALWKLRSASQKEERRFRKYSSRWIYP